MTPTARPRRSALFVPGVNARALEKSAGLDVDVLMPDLEDAVLPDRKDAARDAVGAALAAHAPGHRERIVRVNGVDTPWFAGDIAAAATWPVDGVLIPKVDDADMVRRASAALDAAGAPPHVALWCMMETPLSMLNAAGIAGAGGRIAGLVMGTSDLAAALHARHTAMRLPFLTGLGLCLLAARAHGLAILDGVYLDIRDPDGFADACRQGVELGFDGKTLIHPDTVASANAIFGPTDAEITGARAIVAAFGAARGQGKGVVALDGKLIEQLHVDDALRTLAMADAIARR